MNVVCNIQNVVLKYWYEYNVRGDGNAYDVDCKCCLFDDPLVAVCIARVQNLTQLSISETRKVFH